MLSDPISKLVNELPDDILIVLVLYMIIAGIWLTTLTYLVLKKMKELDHLKKAEKEPEENKPEDKVEEQVQEQPASEKEEVEEPEENNNDD